MSEVRSKSALDVLGLYLVLSRIIGVRSMDSKNCFKLTLSIMFASFIFCYYIIVWLITIQHRRSYAESRNRLEIIEYLYNVALVLRILTVIASVGLGLFQTKLRDKSAKSLNEVDETLKLLGSKTSFYKIYLRSTIEITIFFVYLTILVFSSIYTIIVRMNGKSISPLSFLWFILLYIYAELVEYTISMDFLSFVRCINFEMQRANDLLNDLNALPLLSITRELIAYRETNNNTCKKVFTISSTRKHSRSLAVKNEVFRIRRLLQVIRQVHLELYKVTKNLSNLYGIQMFLGMAMNLFYNTCFLYTIYSFKSHLINGQFLFNEILLIVLFCLIITMKIGLINYTCEKAVQNAEKTNEIIYTFYGENTDDDTRQEVKMFSLQMYHCRPVYSAFGLYSLNCKYICSCIGIITTFLVIMIQMTEPTPNEKYKFHFM